MNNMKHIYITLLLFLLASCQQEEPAVATDKGYLFLSSIELQAETIGQIATRAVSPDLVIEILKGDGIQVFKFDAGAAEANDKIELDAGTYKLKAYSPNYGTTWENNEQGTPIYYKELDFSIKPEKVNYLAVEVPMVNFGVKLVLPDNFNALFGSYTFAVQLGSRSVVLQEGETAYFDLPTQNSSALLYTLTATNSDDETLSKTDSYSELSAGIVYEITYQWANEQRMLVTSWVK